MTGTGYSNVARRLRLPLGFVFGAIYLLVARPTPLLLAIGGIIAFAGLLIRGWAAGHIVKNDQLATTGPYAHTRNPLYLGSFLIAVGFAFAAHWTMLVLVGFFFAFVYGPTIGRERDFVRARFPDAYQEWAAHVPLFFPRLTPWSGGARSESTPFSWPLYLRHREWQAALVFVLVIVWLALVAWRVVDVPTFGGMAPADIP